MKFRFIIFFLFCYVSATTAQEVGKNILFLIPFEYDSIQKLKEKDIKTQEDILNFPSFKMFGFWEGAKMAIEDFINDDIELNVIVRDVGLDETKVEKVFYELRETDIDLIIGPFYAKPFALAAHLAMERRIPIVNPFSNRNDFLDSNQYVYKLVPNVDKQPFILNELFIKNRDNINIILWTNGKENNLLLDNYKFFFTQNNLSYSEVQLSDGFGGLKNKIAKKKENLILAFHESNTAIITHLQSLMLTKDTTITILAPESWLKLQNVDFAFYEALHLHFFSNYFVNTNDDYTELFTLEYITRFKSYPSLERFSFQGYDITRYFLEMLIHNFDSKKVSFQPLSYDFEFEKEGENGFENIKSRLISFKNYEFVEVK